MMSEANIKKAKKLAARRGTSVSKIVEDYIILLDKIEQRLKKDEIHPFVKEFGGMVNSGKDENKKTILAKRFVK